MLRLLPSRSSVWISGAELKRETRLINLPRDSGHSSTLSSRQ